MDTKKTNKTIKLPTFNRKNAEAFGDFLYTDKGGVVSFVKMCDGSLKMGKKVAGQIQHCVLGEAYAHFVEPEVRTPFNKNPLARQEFASNWLGKDSSEAIDGTTGIAIDQLVDTAQLKSSTPAAKKKLALALQECVVVNDDTGNHDDISTYAARAENVAIIWRKRVLPLLK